MSLGTQAARNLATTTKTQPQMRGITSRWLLKLLPWVEAVGGSYRVNRRLSYAVGDGRVSFTSTGTQIRVIPQELTELPLLRGLEDVEVLNALANQFVQREFAADDVIIQEGQQADQVLLIAHGKVNKIETGKPCNKIPVTTERTSSIILMRPGATNQSVIGLHKTGIPDEYQPSLSVRFMGINQQSLCCNLNSVVNFAP
jgi:hypothetical protein